MPLWLMGLITSLSLLTAFKCPKCQNIGKPDDVIKLIRETPIVVFNNDTSKFMEIPNGKYYYQAFYFTAVGCSGLRADSLYTKVRYFVADHAVVTFPDSEQALGFYDPQHNLIGFSLAGVSERKVITHEFLHLLLWANKLEDSTTIDRHPSQYFNEKCKGFVFPH